MRGERSGRRPRHADVDDARNASPAKHCPSRQRLGEAEGAHRQMKRHPRHRPADFFSAAPIGLVSLAKAREQVRVGWRREAGSAILQRNQKQRRARSENLEERLQEQTAPRPGRAKGGPKSCAKGGHSNHTHTVATERSAVQPSFAFPTVPPPRCWCGPGPGSCGPDRSRPAPPAMGQAPQPPSRPGGSRFRRGGGCRGWCRRRR